MPGHVAASVAIGMQTGLQISVLGRRIGVREPPPGLRAGDPVNVVLRPESIGLEAIAGDAGTAGLPPATITARTFLGEKLEYLVECGGQTLQVAQHSAGPNAPPLRVGEQVQLSLPEGDVAVLGVASP